MNPEKIRNCTLKIETILEHKDKVTNCNRHYNQSLDGQFFQPYLGLCSNANLFSLMNEMTDLNYISREETIEKMSLLKYLAVSFCVKLSKKIDFAYPVENGSSLRMWENAERWDYVEHCLSILKIVQSGEQLAEIQQYALRSTENLKSGFKND